MISKRPQILLTGAAGFIGFHLQKALKAHADVFLLDALVPHQFASIVRANLLSSLHTDMSAVQLEKLLEGTDCIIHLAAETGIALSAQYPSRYLDTNVHFTMRLLEAAQKAGVPNFIYASSSSVYAPYSGSVKETDDTSDQLSFYGTTKKMMEQLVAAYAKQVGMRAIGLRFFTVYGSWTRPDMAAYKFMTAIAANQPITIYNPETLQRDFTHVSEIVDSILGLLQQISTLSPGQHEIFNIGYGSPVLVSDFAAQIANALAKPLIVTVGKLPSNEALSTHANVEKLHDFLGKKLQISTRTGVAEMVEWFKSSPYE